MSWDKRWMGLGVFISSWSKDESRKTFAVIVDDRECLLSIGWNGFPRGVADDVPSRLERPAKYAWTEHAERNAIYNAASSGHSVRGARMYMGWYPCAPCASAIIQSGISKLICVEPDWDDPKWAADFEVVRPTLEEGGVKVEFVDWMTAPEIQ